MDPALQGLEGPNLTQWYVGFIIGFVVIVAVVVLVAAILMLASRIARQAMQGTEALEEAQDTTMPLWDLGKIHTSLQGILTAAQSTRRALGGS